MEKCYMITLKNCYHNIKTLMNKITKITSKAEISFLSENDGMIMYEIQLDYNMTLVCLLRKILKLDDLVSRVLVVKDNTVISFSSYSNILVDSNYSIIFPQRNVSPSEYFVKVIISKIVL